MFIRKHTRRAIFAATLALTLPAMAQTLYWDPGRTGTTTGGGNGGWLDADVWYDAEAEVNVSWTAGRNAVFGGTAGRIQLNGSNGATVSVGNLHFATSGYIVDLSAEDGTGTTTLNLAATGIGGENGQIVKSVEGGNWRTFTLNLAADTTHTWGGEIGGSGSTRMQFTKAGAGTINMEGTINLVGWGQPSLSVSGGRLNLIGSNSGSGSLRLILSNDAVLDVGNNEFRARQIAIGSDATVVSAGSGRIRHVECRCDNAVYDGLLTGSLGVTVETGYDLGNNRESRITGNNDYSGGTFFDGTLPNASRIGLLRVTQNNGLGSGPVGLRNTDGTARLVFESSMPMIGSL